MSLAYRKWELGSGVLRARYNKKIIGSLVQMQTNTKVLNVHNSHTNVTPKVEVHLGVIGLQPLHSPPSMKMCFTHKHMFGLMGLWTSHLIVNPLLGLQQTWIPTPTP
jgi:hypothetical protein